MSFKYVGMKVTSIKKLVIDAAIRRVQTITGMLVKILFHGIGICTEFYDRLTQKDDS